MPTWSPKCRPASNTVLTARWAYRLSWSGVLLALLLGIAARNCILVASAVMLGIYVARLHLRNREAVELMRCAMQCWIVGAASILIGFALLAMVGGMGAGLWEGNYLDLSLLLFLVGLCSLPASVLARGNAATGFFWPRWLVVTASMLLFAFAARSIDAKGPCLFSLGVALMTAVTGWQLAREPATQLARSATRMR